MNWEFHSVHETDSKELIKEFSQLAAEGLEQWLDSQHSLGFIDEQPESSFSEFPRGFYHEGPSYNFRFRAYGEGGCLSPAEYDVTVQQTFYPDYTPPLNLSRRRNRTIFRYADNLGPIC
jgi:hypothetical protein